MQVIYSASKTDRAHKHSLVDRGANRGVAGSEVRFIHINTDKRVDIRDYN